MTARAPTQRGAALLMVLALLAVISAAAIGLTITTQRTFQQVAAAQARDRAAWALIGAETAALALLQAQNSLGAEADTLDEQWLAAPIPIPLAEGLLTLTFKDRSACFNVNHLLTAGDTGGYTINAEGVRRFTRWIEALGGAERTGEALALALADFMDSDQTREPGGAEDSVYDTGEAPYRTASVPLTDVSEVRAVAGWTANTYRVLAPQLCAVPGSTSFHELNVNTLTVEDAPLAFAALDGRVPLNTLERLIERRPAQGYADTSAFFGEWAFQGLTPPLTNVVRARFQVDAKLVELEATAIIGELDLTMTSTIRKQGREYTVIGRRLGPADL